MGALAPEPVRSTAAAVLCLGTLLAIVIGVRINRPQPAWPWWLWVPTGVLFTVGGVLREALGTTGDLSAGRSLWPDVFTIPAYLLLAVALTGLLRAREPGRDLAVVLDCAMLAVGALLLGWTVLSGTLLVDLDAATQAKLGILSYPPISVVLVALSARLAFSPGRQIVSYRILLAGMVGLLFGDLLYLFVEAGAVSLPGDLANLPYALAYVVAGTATLHPSMTRVVSFDSRTRGQLTRGRLVLVSLALLAPSALLMGWTAHHRTERVAVGMAAGLLAALAIVRVVAAMRQQSRSEATLAHRATHDALTGLPNRVVLNEKVDDLLRAGERVALLYCDVDQFKLVNDTLGHHVGDQLLVGVAERLVAVSRPGDLVTRLSGDEFALVTVVLDQHEARDRAEELREAFTAPFELGRQVHVTVSIGVSVPLDAQGPATAVELLRDADTAMYGAKSAGRNAVRVADVAMRQSVTRRVELEHDLRIALGEGTLDVHYQPLITLGTGAVRGFEALVRWPDRGSPPDEFIPIAEDSGLIVPLGAWVLDRAVGQLAQWRRRPWGRHVTMSVNLASRQLRDDDVVELVAEALARHRVPGEALCLELTESAMMEDTIDTAAALEELRSLGVQLSIDDFGTGYSSLSYLHRFPIDQLKIDRAFVFQLGVEGHGESVVQAIIAMAAALGITTTAEGIEQESQLDTLLRMGCGAGQGWLFSRAVPACEVEAVVARLEERALGHLSSTGAPGRERRGGHRGGVPLPTGRR